MGKAKHDRSRQRAQREQHSPLAGTAGAHAAFAAAEGGDGTDLVLRGLASSDTAQRADSCQAVASLFADQDTFLLQHIDRRPLVRRFSAPEALRLLLQRLAEPEDRVLLPAIGAIRNLLVCARGAGADTADKMVRAGFVAPVVAVVLGRAQEAPVTAANAVHVLAKLCEDCEAAVGLAGQSAELLPALLTYASGSSEPLVEAASQCLHVLSDNNPAFWAALLGTPELLQGVVGLLTAQERDATCRLHMAGALLNTMQGAQVPLEGEGAAALDGVCALLCQAVNFDCEGAASLAAQVLAARTAEEAADPVAGEGEATEQKGEGGEVRARDCASDALLRQWKTSVSRLVLALECVANGAASGSGDALGEEAFAAADNLDDDELGDEVAAAGASPYAHALVRAGLLRQCLSVLGSVCALPHERQELAQTPFYADMCSLRHRAASALGNLIQNAPADSVPHQADVWPALAQLLHGLGAEPSSPRLTEVLEALTAAQWFLLLRALGAGLTVAASGEQLAVTVELAQRGASTEVRCNCVRVLAALGQQPHDAQTSAVLGQAFLRALEDEALEVVVETLHALFQVFGGEDHDDVFVQVGLPQALQALLPLLTTKIRTEARNFDRDVVLHFKEARVNLRGFLQYKAAHLPPAQ